MYINTSVSGERHSDDDALDNEYLGYINITCFY